MKFIGYIAAMHSGFISGFIELLKKLDQETVINADMNKYNWTICTPTKTYCGIAYEDIQGAVDPVKYFPFTKPDAILLSPLIPESVYQTIDDYYGAGIPIDVWLRGQDKTMSASRFYKEERSRLV